MSKITGYFECMKIGLAMVLLTLLTGCVGYADGGAVVAGPDVDIYGPDVGFYGGFYDRGRAVHAYHDRGFRSRGLAHPGGWGHGRRR
jgi:hypothetical protein